MHSKGEVMANREPIRLLTINTGSSSLKAALYEGSGAEARVLSVQAERIGLAGSHFRMGDDSGKLLVDEPGELADHAAAVAKLVDWLRGRGLDHHLQAIGHRVVH